MPISKFYATAFGLLQAVSTAHPTYDQIEDIVIYTHYLLIPVAKELCGGYIPMDMLDHASKEWAERNKERIENGRLLLDSLGHWEGIGSDYVEKWKNGFEISSPLQRSLQCGNFQSIMVNTK